MSYWSFRLECEKKLLLPYNGVITVECGAKLIVDGGTITKANTYGSNQYWRGIAVNGNAAMAQPLATASPAATESGIVIVKNDGFIEDAVVGITTKKSPFDDDPAYWGGLIDVENGTFRNCRKGVEFMAYDFSLNKSRFKNARFIRTNTGYSYAGVTIWGTDGLSFEGCSFLFGSNTTGGTAETGIRSSDAIFAVTKGNSFSGADIGILTGASTPLNGEMQVGLAGNTGANRNVFMKNAVGILATANDNIVIENNDFADIDFDVAVNGTTRSNILHNIFTQTAAGTRFENTSFNANSTRCNLYSNTLVGTNIVGDNRGFNFRQEDFATIYHDLYINGHSDMAIPMQTITAGHIPHQGTAGAARFNFFTQGQKENIKTNSTVLPTNVTNFFRYFHPNPSANARLKPKCGQGDVCDTGITASNFANEQTIGDPSSCGDNPEEEPCKTKPCLLAVRSELSQKKEQLKSGDVAALYTALQNNGAAEATYNYLSAASPFLSDELLKAIADNTAMSVNKKELLLQQNSPLAEPVITYLPGKISANKLAELNTAAQSGVISAKDALQADIDALTTLREYITDALIREYRAAGQWSQVEILLNEDLNPYNRRRLFGAKVKQKQYTAAAAVLQAMPIESADDTYFVQVQTVNLARMSTNGYLLSAADDTLLNQIALKPTPAAGYAQALLGLLKEQVFMPAPLDLGEKEEKEEEERSNKSSRVEPIAKEFVVTPNPAGHIIQLQLPPSTATDLRVVCFDLVTGRLAHTISLQSGGTTTIPVENWQEGMYLFVLQINGKATARERVLIQH